MVSPSGSIHSAHASGASGGLRGWGFGLASAVLEPRAQALWLTLSLSLFGLLLLSGALLFRYSDTEDLLSRGKQYLLEGKAAWAAETFRRLVHSSPKVSEGYLRLGQAYLELGEPQLAQQAFETAALLESPAQSLSQTPAQKAIAQANLAVASGQFASAKTQLLTVLKALPPASPQTNAAQADLNEALATLHTLWGLFLLEEAHQPQQAALRFEEGLSFIRPVTATQAERRAALVGRTVDALLQAQAYKAQRHGPYAQQKALLLKALGFQYNPVILLKLAQAAQQAGQPQAALSYYEEAFTLEPALVAKPFSLWLQQEEKRLLALGKPQAAQKPAALLKQVVAQGLEPISLAWPVMVNALNLTTVVLDKDTGELKPRVQLNLSNQRATALPFVQVKAIFYSGDKPLTTAIQTVRLLGAGQSRSLSLQPLDELDVYKLEEGKLKAKVWVAFSEAAKPHWLNKAQVEKTVLTLPVGLPKPWEPPLPPNIALKLQSSEKGRAKKPTAWGRLKEPAQPAVKPAPAAVGLPPDSSPALPKPLPKALPQALVPVPQ